MTQFSHISTWIFDLDNTLYDDRKAGIEARVKAHVTEVLADMKGVAVEQMQDVLTELRKKHGTTLRAVRDDPELSMEELVRRTFSLDYSAQLGACAATRERLLTLSGRKVVFTNSHHIHSDQILKLLGFGDVFEHVFEISQFDYEIKPHRPLYDQVVQHLDVDPKTCAMVEDKTENLKPAHDMGMTTVLVHRPEAELEDHVHHVFDDLQMFLQKYHAC